MLYELGTLNGSTYSDALNVHQLSNVLLGHVRRWLRMSCSLDELATGMHSKFGKHAIRWNPTHTGELLIHGLASLCNAQDGCELQTSRYVMRVGRM